jgi:hypothetical protein
VLNRLTYCALALENAKPSSTVNQTRKRFGGRCDVWVKNRQQDDMGEDAVGEDAVGEDTVGEEKCICFSLSKH